MQTLQDCQLFRDGQLTMVMWETLLPTCNAEYCMASLQNQGIREISITTRPNLRFTKFYNLFHLFIY